MLYSHGSHRRTYGEAHFLGDQDPDLAKKWDAFEKSFILPKLNLDESKNVVDCGCGMGRWAESVAPICNHYTGVDFSGEMIAVAKKKVDRDNCLFINKSLLDSLDDESLREYKYDVVIITGVSMYINDDELVECYEKISRILNKGAIVYIEESVGIKERLTLNHIWSDNLDSYYEAIYRTEEEYLSLQKCLIEKSDIKEKGFLRELDLKDHAETSHWYIILSYKGE